MDEVEANFQAQLKQIGINRVTEQKSKDYGNFRITEKREEESTYLEC